MPILRRVRAFLFVCLFVLKLSYQLHLIISKHNAADPTSHFERGGGVCKSMHLSPLSDASRRLGKGQAAVVITPVDAPE